jgi:hypothetical protein
MTPLIIIIIDIVGLGLIMEFATSVTIGTRFIHERSHGLLEQEINGASEIVDGELLSIDHSRGMIHLGLRRRGPMSGRYISWSCQGLLSRYYISTDHGNYRVYRFSKMSKYLTAIFRNHISSPEF